MSQISPVLIAGVVTVAAAGASFAGGYTVGRETSHSIEKRSPSDSDKSSGGGSQRKTDSVPPAIAPPAPPVIVVHHDTEPARPKPIVPDTEIVFGPRSFGHRDSAVAHSIATRVLRSQSVSASPPVWAQSVRIGTASSANRSSETQLTGQLCGEVEGRRWIQDSLPTDDLDMPDAAVVLLLWRRTLDDQAAFVFKPLRAHAGYEFDGVPSGARYQVILVDPRIPGDYDIVVEGQHTEDDFGKCRKPYAMNHRVPLLWTTEQYHRLVDGLAQGSKR
jgi:hypothetical protein